MYKFYKLDLAMLHYPYLGMTVSATRISFPNIPMSSESPASIATVSIERVIISDDESNAAGNPRISGKRDIIGCATSRGCALALISRCEVA